MAKPWENKSGCKDPTAYEAEKELSEEDKRLFRLISTLKYIIDQAGYELVSRIELRDRHSGRIHR